MSKIYTWLNGQRKELLLGFIILLISSTSFALGYRLAEETNAFPIVVEQCSKPAETLPGA